MLAALLAELQLRKDEFKNQTVETIYFGGGTPSLLTPDELQSLIDEVYNNYKVTDTPEITLEANPDDLTPGRLKALADLPINRLSIGIQSFYEDDLKLMNRAHNTQEAKKCLSVATRYFDNISVDLIYGIPGLTNERWLANVETALSFGIPHISSYALTVEPRTALENFIKKGLINNVDDDLAREQFYILVEKLEENGFIHYELSNFGKSGYFSKNNTSYWLGKPYLGIGPSAHSFDGNVRGWNVSNNTKYIQSILKNSVPIETEKLTLKDRYNECVMTGLRTIWGVSLEKIEKDFGTDFKKYLLEQADTYLNRNLLYLDGDKLLVCKNGKFLSDGIAADLFKID